MFTNAHLQVRHLNKRFGAESVFSDVSFVLNAGQHAALIGPNGSGKSTILRCIAGDETPDGGEIVLSPPGARVGYLAQALDLPHESASPLTFAEALDLAQANFRESERALTHAAERLGETGSGIELDAATAAYDAALAAFEALGGYDREARAAAILTGLGLARVDRSLPITSLSGGQKTRLGMATLLLAEPDILLLDEPTNHLDIQALDWLESFIRGFSGAILLVSHDRDFLDRTVDWIFYLDEATGGIQDYPGDYTDFADTREDEATALRETWARQQKYVSQVRGDVARLKSGALAIEKSTTPRQPGVRRLARKKAALAKSREKKLERFLESDERVDKPTPRWELKLDFGEPPPSGRAVLHLDRVSFAFPGARPLFHDLSLDVQYQDRIALVGSNGSGKTTLLKIIAGEIAPTSGEVRLGAGVRLGVLAQEQELLDPGQRVLDLVLNERPLSETEARGFLHFFLFSGDEVFRKIGECSFGERTRLQLARLVLRGCNLLLLDEPLNHLDIEGRVHFAEALEAFEGTIIAVAHDRAFLRDFSQRVVALEDGEATVFEGGYEAFELSGAKSS